MTDTTDDTAAGHEARLYPAAGTEHVQHANHDSADRPERGPADEAERQEAERQEAERLALLDMETEDDKAGRPLDTGVWGSTGHPGVDAALQRLQNSGLTTDDAVALLYDAAAARDPGMVDRKALEAKIGPRRTRAIMDTLTAFSKEMQPKDARIRGEVYQLTNGPHELRRLIAHAEQVLPASEVQDYVRALGKGGAAARRAVENLQAIAAGEADRRHRRVNFDQAPAEPRGKPAGITSAEYYAPCRHCTRAAGCPSRPATDARRN